MNVVNFIISKDLLELSQSWNINCRAVYETRAYGSMGGARIYSPSALFSVTKRISMVLSVILGGN